MVHFTGYASNFIWNRITRRSIACDKLSVGEDFDLEDYCTTRTARSQEHQDPDVETTNVDKKIREKLLQKVPRKR